MRYTRTDHPRAAARTLAELVPLAVVTLGAEGALRGGLRRPARPRRSPRCSSTPSTRPARATCSCAGFVTGTLAGWPLADRLAFASLCAALSVQEFGGSLSAPGWTEIAALVGAGQGVRGPGRRRREALRRYAFLDALLPAGTRPWPLRRAVPTIGFRPAVRARRRSRTAARGPGPPGGPPAGPGPAAGTSTARRAPATAHVVGLVTPGPSGLTDQQKAG